MRIIHLTTETLDIGKAAFTLYTSAQVCGPTAAIHDTAMYRDAGIEVIPGAVSACIERGMTSENEILNAVARASRCRRRTVQAFLEALTGKDPERHLWHRKGDRYSNLRVGDEPGTSGSTIIVTH